MVSFYGTYLEKLLRVANNKIGEKKISIVLSVYNEEEGLKHLWSQFCEELNQINHYFEVIFVNDGSTDNSQEIINNLKSSVNIGIKSISFSRNFGHEAAMVAGLDYANGEAIIFMDADLQHPPSEIIKMINLYIEGTHIVTMKQQNREDHNFIKRFFSRSFYKVINSASKYKIEENASDFFLISEKVAKILRKDFREVNRFLRGFIQIVGFSKQSLTYSSPKRIHGKSKYSLFKLLRLSFRAVSAFSKAPLYLGLFFGAIFGILSLILGGYSLVMYLHEDQVPSGYTTLIIFLSINFTILFFLLGIIGTYIGYNFDETKKRPIYIVEEFKDIK